MTGRKPPWLKLLYPQGMNPAHLTARRCRVCREWTVVDTKGTVEETYDPGVLDTDDLTVAIILGRPFIRIQPIAGTGLISLRTVCGVHGVRPDDAYLAMHECFRTPISSKPYKPARPVKRRRSDGLPRQTQEDIHHFETAWRRPT